MTRLLSDEIEWTVTIESIDLACRYWPGPCNEDVIRVAFPLAHPERAEGRDCDTYKDGVTLPSRRYVDYPVDDNRDNPANYHVIPGGRSHGPTTPFEVFFAEGYASGKPSNSPFSLADPNVEKLCAHDGKFVRMRPEIAATIVASLRPLIARADDPKLIAKEAARRVPTGTSKEDFLPFVTAVLRYLDRSQSRAMDRDEAAASFAVAGEQVRYREDFRRLTGREFDPATDRITWAEIEALPVTPPVPPSPYVEECLECGATYGSPGHVEPGGMGCDRCNS
jgi:hypothetical protein